MRTVRVSKLEMQALIESETARPSEPPTVPDKRRELIESTDTDPEITTGTERLHIAIGVVITVAVVVFGIFIAWTVSWR